MSEIALKVFNALLAGKIVATHGDLDVGRLRNRRRLAPPFSETAEEEPRRDARDRRDAGVRL